MGLLTFQPLSSGLDPSFWAALTELKIDVLKLDQTPLPASGSYTHASHVKDRQSGELVGISSAASFTGTDLKASNGSSGQGSSSARAKLQGTLRNFNTIEDFKKEDKQAALNQAVAELWQKIVSSDKAMTAQELNPFLVLTFADLKKYKYYYWFCFPAFVPQPAWEVSSLGLQGLAETLDQNQVRSA